LGKNGGMNAAVRDLQTLFDVGAMGVFSDGQLLDRFVARREGAVFEAIVHRHGPMVWGVCRRVLRDHHDAEDAFQATFLVLARKAASVMPREKVGNWLYGVACQTAMKARVTKAKRRGRESQAPDVPEPEAVREGPLHDLLPELDRELSRLPEKYRVPIVLCELEGKTHREAAEQLGWPIGTVSGRL
jgi:RNA polymerase sigma factor (sigma-70 family)